METKNHVALQSIYTVGLHTEQRNISKQDLPFQSKAYSTAQAVFII